MTTRSKWEYGGPRNRSSLGRISLAWLEPIRKVLDELRDFWPLTLRQVYYQLVSSEVIKNELSQYKKLSTVLAQARIEGRVSWASMEDRSRASYSHAGWSDWKAFVIQERDNFLGGYRRDLLQGQETRPEIWIEKDALSSIFSRTANYYCVRVVVGRGFSSISYMRDLYQRHRENMEGGQTTTILYFGNLDPSGWEMVPAMQRTLAEDFNVPEGEVDIKRIALMPDQVGSYNLPHNPQALKWTDSRARKYVLRFGELAVELDALSPGDLMGMARRAIEEVIDMDEFDVQRSIGDEDEAEIERAREGVEAALEGLL